MPQTTKQLFTVQGHYRGKEASLTWADGRIIEGHPKARALVNKLAREREEVGIEGTELWTTKAHLSSPFSALVLMGEALFPVTGATGQVPQVPQVPPGAVA